MIGDPPITVEEKRDVGQPRREQRQRRHAGSDRGLRDDGSADRMHVEEEEVDERKLRALPLLESDVNRAILATVRAAGSLTVGELERRLYLIAPRTLSDHRAYLADCGVLVQEDRGGTDRTVSISLTPRGRRLDRIQQVLRKALRIRPVRPVESDGPEVRAAVRAVLAGLRTGVIQQLDGGPQSLSEFESALPIPKNRIQTALRLLVGAGIVEQDDSSRYELTNWGRLLLTPIAGATHWDRASLPEGRAVTTTHDAAAFLRIALGRVQLRKQDHGILQLRVEPDPDAGVEGEAVLVWVEIERGRITSCELGRAREATSWASGTPAAIYDAIQGRRPDALDIKGDDPELAEALVRKLYAEFVLELGIDPHGFLDEES